MVSYHLEKVKSVKEGVIRLFTIRDLPIPEFDVVKRGEGEYTDTLVWDGKEIPLHFWRYEPRIEAMYDYGRHEPEKNNCLNTYSFVGSDIPLDALIYQELGIAEYVISSPIVKVTAFINGAACNLLAKTASGAMVGLELGATMAPGTIPQFNHRLITTHGMATDRTVNTLVEQSGVYLFKNDDRRPYEFNDGEYYLFGLTPEETWCATLIQGIIKGAESGDALIRDGEHLKRVLSAVHTSSEEKRPVEVLL